MIENQVVVITGASSGIGKACAFFFSEKGAKIVVAARDLDRLEQIAETINKNGGEALAVKVDVTSEEECKGLIDKTVKRFNRIDILINNAGISMRANFLDVKLDVLRKLMDVNFWGTVYCTKYSLPHIIKTRGSIVGVTSIAGFHGLPGRTGYSASKFAMHGFLETIRIENLKNGVHVLIAAPGFTATEVRKRALVADGSSQGETPRNEKSMMTPEEVARKIYMGIRFRRRNIILTWVGKGSVLLQRIIPRTLDRLFYNAMKREPNSPLK